MHVTHTVWRCIDKQKQFPFSNWKLGQNIKVEPFSGTHSTWSSYWTCKMQAKEVAQHDTVGFYHRCILTLHKYWFSLQYSSWYRNAGFIWVEKCFILNFVKKTRFHGLKPVVFTIVKHIPLLCFEIDKLILLENSHQLLSLKRCA